jgi:predicted ATPase
MVTSLHLNNFKCFESQSIDFSPLTVLTGLNGMGKSSAMQALLLIRQSYQQGLLEKTGLALNGDLVRIGTSKDALYETAEDDFLGIRIRLEDGSDAGWVFRYSNPDANVMDLESAEVSPGVLQCSLFNDDFEYLQAERIGPRPTFDTSDFIVRQHHQLGTRGEFTAFFLSVFGRDNVPNAGLMHPMAASASLRDQVEAWMGEISPGTRLHFESLVGTDLISLQYSFAADQQVSNTYRSTNVGFGITYTLPILVALLAARSGAFVMIENPEAHLHPKGQVEIGILIARAASSNMQVVVETHSDHILNGVRIAVRSGIIPPHFVALHFLERQVSKGKMRSMIDSPRIDRDGRIDHWPAGFFDEFDKSLELLLKARSS